MTWDRHIHHEAGLDLFSVAESNLFSDRVVTQQQHDKLLKSVVKELIRIIKAKNKKKSKTQKIELLSYGR